MSIAIRHIIFVLLLAIMPFITAVGQESVQDYRQYKYYDEDEDDMSWLLQPLMDSMYVAAPQAGYIDSFAPNARYSLSAVSHLSRGFGYDEEGDVVSVMPIDYRTARLLSSLGVTASYHVGMSLCTVSGAVGATSSYDPFSRSRYGGHYLRGEFSGCNYLGGLSYRATYLPTRDGIRYKHGWSITHVARARAGRDIYVDGVATTSLDLGVEALYSDRNNKVAIYALLPMSERGVRQASTEEAYSLTGNTMYNPSWGIDMGKVRNSRVSTTLHPEVIAGWQGAVSALSNINIWLDVGYIRGGYTTLAGFDVRTPQPDNYRYMPSYYADDDICHQVEQAWINNDLRYTQIDWQDMRHTNLLQQDGHARHAVERRVDDNIHSTLVAGMDSRVGGAMLRYGVIFNYLTERRYKIMDDLLGADHIVDYDYYIEDDATYGTRRQNNMRTPDRVVYEGERFGYDYRLTRIAASLYGSAEWMFDRLSVNVSANISSEHTVRRGYFEKELFAGSGSYGRSNVVRTNPYRLTAACHYHHGSHAISSSVMLRGTTPDADDLFLQPQYNNRTVTAERLMTTLGGELSYMFTRPRVKVAATLYVIYCANESSVVRYYDDLAAIYTNMVVDDICRLHFGVESSAAVSWSRYFSSTFAVTATSYRYAGDATATLYTDTENSLYARSTVKLRGFHGSSPELTAYGDITLRKSGWMASLSVQYWGLRYAEPSYVRRSERVLSYALSKEERLALLDQHRMSDAATMDVRVSKRWRLGERYSLYVQLSLRNLLGSDIVYREYEQDRIRRTRVANHTHISSFDNRMTYAYPRTIYLSVGFGF